MEFRVLGPLEVDGASGPIGIGGARQRTLLAALLLRPNRVRSRDELVEAVWGDAPPDTATTALQGYVSALRKELGAERIVTRPPGYVLVAVPEEIDLARFEQASGDGRAALAAGRAEEALHHLDEALALWRGELVADLDAPFLDGERRRAEERRLETGEARVDAALALGRHAETIPELQALVAAHPLRERLRGQLMLAYYRAGRQAEALDTYRQGRQVLGEELGLEPGASLRELERAILEHDPALGAVDGPSTAVVGRPARRRTIGLIALALGVAAAAAVVIARAASDDTPRVAVPANAVAEIDPSSLAVVGSIPVGSEPRAIATGLGAVWTASAGDGTVSRIDPTTGKVTARLDVGDDPHDLAVGFGSLWVAGGSERTVERVDPATHEVVATIMVGASAPDASVFFVAADTTAIWATIGDRLVRIDPATNEVVATTRIPWPTGLAAAGDMALVTSDDGLTRVAASNPASTSQPFSRPVAAPAPDRGAVWMLETTGTGDVTVFRDDLSALTLDDPVRFPLDLAVGEGAAWVVTADGELLRIDETLSGVTGRVSVAPTVRSALAVGFGRVWMTVEEPA